MLTDEAVFCSATPISSAIAMNRLLITSSITGSAVACRSRGDVARRGAGEDEIAERVDLGLPAGLDHGGGGGVDDEGGAGDDVAGRQDRCGHTGPPHAPQGEGDHPKAGGGVSSRAVGYPSTVLRTVPLPIFRWGGLCPTASTIAVSITTAVSGAMKPKRALCAASKSSAHSIRDRRLRGSNRCPRSAAPRAAGSRALRRPAPRAPPSPRLPARRARSPDPRPPASAACSSTMSARPMP